MMFSRRCHPSVSVESCQQASAKPALSRLYSASRRRLRRTTNTWSPSRCGQSPLRSDDRAPHSCGPMFDALNSARSRTQRQIRTALACSEYLFAKNVGVPAVVSVLSQHVHVDPSQRQWTSPISMDEVICAQVRNSLPRPGTRFQVGLPAQRRWCRSH